MIIVNNMKYNLLIAMIWGLMACSGSNNHHEHTEQLTPELHIDNHQDTIKSYRVGMDMKYIPYNFRDEKQRVQGLDVDILRAIADDQGFHVEFVLIEYNLLLKYWQQQQISIIMDGIAADDVAHDPNLVVSDPYYVSYDCIAATKAEYLQDWQHRQVALVPDDLLDQELIQQNILKHHQINLQRTVLLAMKEVASQRADVAISDCTAMKYLAKRKTFDSIPFVFKILPHSDRMESAGLVIAVDKNQPELLQQINAGIRNLKANGELNRIIHKWQ